jgi:hypothetical protein
LFHFCALQLNDDKHRALEQILDTTQYLLKICGNVKNSPDESKFRRVGFHKRPPVAPATLPTASLTWCKLIMILLASHLLQIRITNPTFARHVRDASGGEQFMRAAGWVLQVHDFEKHFAFEHQPGQWEWRVLEAACVELEKLIALLQGKIQVQTCAYEVQGWSSSAWQHDGVSCRCPLGGPAACARSHLVPCLLPALQRGMGDKKAAQEKMRQQVRAALEDDKAQREVMFQPHSAPVGAHPLPASPRSRGPGQSHEHA